MKPSAFFKPIDERETNVNNKGKSCISCGLYQHVNTPRMKPFGKFKKKIMVIGSSPGRKDDLRGKPWQENYSNILITTLKKYNIDLFNDCVSLNACNCKVTKDEPSTHQIDCCRKKVIHTIQELNPKIIILAGGSALKSVIPPEFSPDAIGRWRGNIIPDYIYGGWVCPIFHPEYVDSQKEKNIIHTLFDADIKKISEYINIDFPQKQKPDLILIKNDDEYRAAIKDIIKYSAFAFDFETTGIKPYAEGHKIVSTSIAVSGLKSYSWLNTPERNNALAKLLKNKRIKKIAHNSSFENMWSLEKLQGVRGWDMCTMITAHSLDNRGSIAGLKLQAYLHFGVRDYSSKLDPYLKNTTKKDGTNAFNKIFEYINKFGYKSLLKYGALDSLYTYKLAKLQKGLYNGANK